MVRKSYEDFCKDREAGKLHGVYENVPNEEYHGVDALSASQFNDLNKSDQWWKYKKENKQERKKCFEIGSALHTAVLEPDRWAKDVMISKKFDRRTKQGKLDAAEFEKGAEGKTLINIEDFQHVKGMRESLESKPLFQDAMSSGFAELSVFGEMNGVLSRCRPDWLNLDAGVMFDIKSAKDASERGFLKDAYYRGYHRQGAFYLDLFYSVTGIRLKSYGFMVVENFPPYVCGLHQMTNQMYGIGVGTYKHLTEVYKRAIADQCIGYGNDFIQMVPLTWMHYELEDMEGVDSE